MKRALLLTAGIAMVAAIAVNASAQQRPEQVPVQTGTTTTTAGTPQVVLPPMRFPAPAATYEKYVKYFIDLLHKPNKLHLTPGETDKIILAYRDCASRAESDGYVSQAEYNYCRDVYKNKVRESATPYVTQAAAAH